MSQAIKICPICQARNQRGAAVCFNCGAGIEQIEPSIEAVARQRQPSQYDFRRGETDLAEASLRRRGQWLGACIIALLVACLALTAGALLLARLAGGAPQSPLVVIVETPTRMSGPTITPGPPTASPTASPAPTQIPSDTPTPAPCLREVTAGDSLIGIILGCGHQNLAIMPTVMALNGIIDEAVIRAGQLIRVPPPTPTTDPLATPAPSPALDSESAAAESALALLAFDPFAPTATPTLLPGLMWHTVRSGETMISIAIDYATNAKGLSDLNPEIQFSLCDFSVAFGGPECTVQLSENQRVRVPAPTPTQTAIPTATGSETPTPTATATFNAPLLQDPPEQTFFAADEQVTLRWVGTGRLNADERYRVTVTATDGDAAYSANTRELFFIVPSQWRVADKARHTYIWQVSVVDAQSGAARHVSEERSFVWQGAGTGL
ncbi:MAG: LysM peptidoglycan-binding domain-containing protein [Chloroflexi bacterium]|nr:LysM peptidoglycan-binding domain-containing protein [Chloroflexota bacterium]MCY4247911.1 LysM peptidoglycan-binding domain-containing protein [Chloroflexota bacterium]